MQKLRGGYSALKYIWQMRTIKSRKAKQASNQHASQGVLQPVNLPFGMSSAPGYFQEIKHTLNHV